MLLNVTICGVVVFDSAEGVNCPMNGHGSLSVQQYNYLGLPMTTSLVLNATVQDRKEKATNAYHAMRRFLMSRHIPAVILAQIVRYALV